MSDATSLAIELTERIKQSHGSPIAIAKQWHSEKIAMGYSAKALHFACALSNLVEEVQTKPSTRQLVLLVHGIRTHAAWQAQLTRVLSAENVQVKPLKYGYLDPLRFWFPFFTRRKSLDKILWRIRDAVKAHPHDKLTIIAHSFGTYAVSRLLEENPDLECHRLVLCGSIIPADFRWSKLPNRPQIVNECGFRDIWPIMAQCLSWGYGSSGAFGFGQSAVEDRHHDMDHSGYLVESFAERFWKPLVHHDEIEASGFDAPEPSYIKTVLTIPLFSKVVAFIVILFCISLVAGLAALMLAARHQLTWFISSFFR